MIEAIKEVNYNKAGLPQAPDTLLGYDPRRMQSLASRRTVPWIASISKLVSAHLSMYGLTTTSSKEAKELARALCPDRALMGAGRESWHDNFSPRADKALGVIGASIAQVVLDPAVSMPTFAIVAKAATAERGAAARGHCGAPPRAAHGLLNRVGKPAVALNICQKLRERESCN